MDYTEGIPTRHDGPSLMDDLDPQDARKQLVQRLDALRRSGLDRIPRPPRVATIATPRAPEIAPPIAPPTPTAPPPPRRIERPAPPPSATSAPAFASSLFGEPELPAEHVPPEERPARLAALAAEVAACTLCPHLASTRTQTVFGEGSIAPRLMFIGEGPGADEDRTGRPFVGKAGILLTDMITKGMGLRREDVYIANVVKSRPLNTDPGRTSDNRPPTPEEIGHCLPYLERQIAILRPEFLCLLGKTPASTLLETALPMNRLRGRWHSYRGIPTVVTWHPAYLLRTPSAKKETWDDLQMLMKRMGLKAPERPRRADS